MFESWIETLIYIFVVVGGGVAALEFHGLPAATHDVERLEAGGWTPRPTDAPMMGRSLGMGMAIDKRQADLNICGFLEGDPFWPMGCYYADDLCLYDPESGWFGCCTGTMVQDCFIQTGCVQSATEEVDDPLVTACTNPSYPYCIPLSSIVDDSTYSHWECGDVQTSYEILPTPTDDFFFTETETETETETDDPFTEILTDFPVRTVTVTADVSSGIVRTVTVTRGEESTTTSESEVSSDLSSTIGTGTTAADVTPTFEQGPARSSNAAAGKGVGVVVGVVGVLGAFGWI